MIATFLFGCERDALPSDQLREALARRFRQRLVGRAVLAELGGVDADQPYLPAIGEDQAVAVGHMPDAGYLTGHRRRGQQTQK